MMFQRVLHLTFRLKPLGLYNYHLYTVDQVLYMLYCACNNVGTMVRAVNATSFSMRLPLSASLNPTSRHFEYTELDLYV